MKARERYEEWLKNASSRSPLYKDLISIDEKDNNEIEERFHQYLTFGTAGLRGKVGAGTNRMNFYMVGKATQGIANYIKGYGQEAMDRGVVIAHDPRHFSKDFSRFAAGVFAAAGIKAYIFPDLRPTPELAYMIGKLHTISGVNITASHNPKDYNGYKVYWEDGCQVSSTIADGMLAEMDKVDLWADIHYMPVELALEEGKVIVLGEEYDRDYLDHIESLAIHEGDELDLDIPLVYTPLNGCGAIPFAEMMKDRGFTNWHMVKEQIEPDPDFTTVGYPNPEDPKAFRLSEELGRQTGAELLMATDPDADRFAIELRDDAGNYIPLNGNQTGYLLVNYILEGRKDAGTMPEKGSYRHEFMLASYELDSGAEKMTEMLTDLYPGGFKTSFWLEDGMVFLDTSEGAQYYHARFSDIDEDGHWNYKTEENKVGTNLAAEDALSYVEDDVPYRPNNRYILGDDLLFVSREKIEYFEDFDFTKSQILYEGDLGDGSAEDTSIGIYKGSVYIFLDDDNFGEYNIMKVSEGGVTEYIPVDLPE